MNARVSSFADVNAVLAEYVPPARAMRANYKLDTMRSLMKHLGNPQDTYKVVHVAGTSGKTSTAYFTASLLKQAGIRVGLTVSPHVDALNERLQIDLVTLAEKAYCQAFNQFMDLITTSGLKPTYFELLVAFAYWYFAEAKVEYAVIEVGLGGLLDGTNVITRTDKIAVLTDVGLDHVDVLGNTLPEIALQKAGIMHAGNHAFCLPQATEITDVFAQHASRVGAELHQTKSVELAQSSLALFQQRNWSLALAVVTFALQRDCYPVLTTQQQRASQRVYIPARMEYLPNKEFTLLLDAAHNPQKMHALVTSITRKYPGQKWSVLLALLHSKDQRLSGVLKELLPITKQLIVTDFVAGQDLRKTSASPKQIVMACKALNFSAVSIEHNTARAYQMVLDAAGTHKLVTGSFYLLQEVHALAKQHS